MKESLWVNDFTDICFGKGQFMNPEELEENIYQNIILYVKWPLEIILEVSTFNNHDYHIIVFRDDTIFESRYCKAAAVVSLVRKLSKNINLGQFNNKKTDKEKAQKIVESRIVSNIEVKEETKELITELEKEHIPYEVDNDIIIYGYR